MQKLIVLLDSAYTALDRVGSVVDASQACTAGEASERILGRTRVFSDSLLDNHSCVRKPKSRVATPALSHAHAALQRMLEHSTHQPGCSCASGALALVNDGIRDCGICSRSELSQSAGSRGQFATCCDLCCATIQSQYPIDPLLDAHTANSPNYDNCAQQDIGNITQEDSAPIYDATLCQMNPHGHNHSSPVCPTDDLGSAPITRTTIDAGVGLQPSLLDRQHIRHTSAPARFQHADCSALRTPLLRTQQSDDHATAGNKPSAPTSHPASDGKGAGVTMACFEEWPLENVVLKRALVDGVATFQMQFDWVVCKMHDLGNAKMGNASKPGTLIGATGGKNRRAYSKYARFTTEEKDFLLSLREDATLSWKDIHQQFNTAFPPRSRQSLQVQYYKSMKRRS